MKTLINTHQILQVNGKDTQDFLQGQLSNDINKLNEKTAQINAYCQHQGRVIALIIVMRHADNFYLMLAKDMLDLVITRLNMFILMSDVKIIKSELLPIGVIGDKGKYKINNELSIELTKENNIVVDNIWEERCIYYKLPEVFLTTSEKFIPQMLNLDINELGLNFSKGCYTGQEVIARLHYLGKAKKRLFKFNSNFIVKVGDILKIENSNSQKSSGIVVRVVKLPTCYYFLATLEIDKITQTITINNQLINFNE